MLISLLGLLGALLLGYVLRGRIGAVVALLLLVASPVYLAQSQTLATEVPCLALELLAVALAYLWWERPAGRIGIYLAVLSAAALVLSISSKLFGLAALVPIGLLVADRLRQILRLPAASRRAASSSLIAGCAAFVVATGVVLLPFAGAWRELWQGVVGFHVVARQVYQGESVHNLLTVEQALVSLLTLAALYGAGVALARRDMRVVPLLAWLAATIYLLWNQTPLVPHHLIMLVAPLVSLATMSVTPLALQQSRVSRCWRAAMLVGVLLILLVSASGLRDSVHYLRKEARRDSRSAQGTQHQVISDLQACVRPGQLVITDEQFVAGLADRSTPADLVDTSYVRIKTGSLTAQQLIDDASQPQVHAVLLYTGRLQILGEFHGWVRTHYRLVRDYGVGMALWNRP